MLLHNLTTSPFGPSWLSNPVLEAACARPIERLEGRLLLAASDGDIVASGDFNDDGRQDIVVYRRNAGKNGGAQLRVMLADNNGYRRGATIQVGRVSDVAVGDFD